MFDIEFSNPNKPNHFLRAKEQTFILNLPAQTVAVRLERADEQTGHPEDNPIGSMDIMEILPALYYGSFKVGSGSQRDVEAIGYLDSLSGAVKWVECSLVHLVNYGAYRSICYSIGIEEPDPFKEHLTKLLFDHFPYPYLGALIPPRPAEKQPDTLTNID